MSVFPLAKYQGQGEGSKAGGGGGGELEGKVEDGAELWREGWGRRVLVRVRTRKNRMGKREGDGGGGRVEGWWGGGGEGQRVRYA